MSRLNDTLIPIPKNILADIEAGKYRNHYLIVNRKSTDDANIQKNSIKYQRSENTRYANKNILPIAPLTIEGFCRDGIISERHSAFKENHELLFVDGNKVQFSIDRPKFYLLTQLLSHGYFKGAIHLCWDRASRNKTDDAVIRKLMKTGSDMRFALAEYDKTSSGELHMDVEGMFAAHHSRVTSEKVTLTTKENRALGIVTHKAGVGYLNTGDMLHKPKDPVRAPLILEFAHMVDSGSSLAAIARHAIASGFTMPPIRARRTDEEMLAEEEEDADGKDVRTKMEKISRLPTATGIHKILTNRFYTGMVKTRDGRWIPSISHEAIIPENLFDRIQLKLRAKNKSTHYANVLNHPCRDMFNCGVCGRVYTPYEQKNIIYFGARCRKECVNPKKSFNFSYITEKVGELMESLPFTDEERERVDARTGTEIALLETKHLSNMEANERKKKKVREDLAYLNTHRLDLLKAGAYTPEGIVAEESKLRVELASLQTDETVSDVAMRETVHDIIKLSELLKDGFNHYSRALPNEKEQLIKVVFSELTLNGETLQFKCKNGFKAFETRFVPNCDPTGSRTPLLSLRRICPSR